MKNQQKLALQRFFDQVLYWLIRLSLREISGRVTFFKDYEKTKDKSLEKTFLFKINF